MLLLKTVYVANILIVGWVSAMTLFQPEKARQTVFGGRYAYSKIYKLVGSLYLSIVLLSAAGLFVPMQMSPLLLFQLVYKIVWLLAAALPAILRRQSPPKVMTVVFLVYVAVLPFVIPWSFIFAT